MSDKRVCQPTGDAVCECAPGHEDDECPGCGRPVSAEHHHPCEVFVRPEGCVCPMFGDTSGFRVADLCCPVHGVGGTAPGDGYWEHAE